MANDSFIDGWAGGEYTPDERAIINNAIANNNLDGNFQFEIDGEDLILSKKNNHGAIFVQIRKSGSIEFSYALRTMDGGIVRLDGNFIKGKKKSNISYMEMIFHLDVAKEVFEARRREFRDLKDRYTNFGINGKFNADSGYKKSGGVTPLPEKWVSVEKGESARIGAEYIRSYP